MKKYIYLFISAVCLSLQTYSQSSLVFSGNSLQSVSLPDTSAYYNSNHGFTWEMWIRPDTIPVGNDTASDPTVGQILFSAEDGVAYEDIALGFGWAYFPENWLTFSVDGQGYGVRDNTPPHYVLPQSKIWYHIAGVCNYDSGYTALYVNGVLVSSSYYMRNNSNFFPLSRNIQPDIGNISSQLGQGFQGEMDEVIIWGYPKSSFQVVTDMDTCYSGLETGMVAYYRCNEGTGTTAHDATPNHFDGTLQDTTNDRLATSSVVPPIGSVGWAMGQPRNICLGTGAIIKHAFCVCSQVNVPFNNSDTLNAGNNYIAQLSDSSGSFTNPSAIGILQSSASSGTIPCFIPCNATPGTQYRIRVVSSSPALVGSDNNVDLTINVPLSSAVSITGGTSDTVCPNAPLFFTALPVNGGPNPSYQWLLNNSPVGTNASAYSNNSWSTGDVVYCIMISNAACTSGFPDTSNIVSIVVGSINAGTVTSPKDTICPQTIANFSLTGNSPGNIQWQSSVTGADYTSITGATQNKYTSQPLSQTTYFRVYVTNAGCADTSLAFKMYIGSAPVAVYTYSIKERTVTFNSAGSTDAVSYTWSFGDGDDTIAENPVHTFDTSGNFQVCLSVKNSTNCNYTLCKNLTIYPNGINEIADNDSWQIYPDPFSDHLYIIAGEGINSIATISMYDMLGRVVLTKNVNGIINNTEPLDVSGIRNGVYFLSIKTKESSFVKMVIKQ